MELALEEACELAQDRISLTGLVFQAHHGMYEWEERLGQPFEVDVDAFLDLAPAGRGDDPALTVDYCLLYRMIQEEVTRRRRGLLEAVAEAVAARVLALGPVEAVTVRVRKPRAALPGATGATEVEVHRLKTT